MKKRMKMAVACVLSLTMMTIVVEPVRATTISDLESQIKDHQDALENINSQIDNMENAQEILEEEIADLNAEMINLMTSIDLLEENIAQKEEDIRVAQTEYENALAMEQKQYEEMLVRIQYMYEQGEYGFWEIFLKAGSFSDMLNKVQYFEQIYSYDRNQLEIYQDTAKKVNELKVSLETEKASLLADMASMEEQQGELDTILAKKKKEVSNYESMLADAQRKAKDYKNKIKQEQKELQKLQAGNTNANNGNYTVTAFDTSIIDNATGSDIGKNIAKYGCQFIGNPYVYGGTSLTNGADCSGFTYRIYADFGYSIPRTSTAQRSCGVGVSYEDAQPGDLICYDGHVALYCGSGYIVHASTQKTGIKVSKATYRPILAVRRVV